MTMPVAAHGKVTLPLSLIAPADGRPQPALGPSVADPAFAESSYDHLVREYGIYDDALLHAVKLLLAREVQQRSALRARPRPAQVAVGFWARIFNF
jgi:hypothetical protein